MEIIALSGFARVGKDTAAAVLVEEFGFKKMAFADKLREAAYALNPLVSAWDMFNGEPRAMYLQDVIDIVGWDGYKETIYSDEIRRLLQRGGTEMGRQVLGKNIWVNALLDSIGPDENIVISDARFINEFNAVIDKGGYIWRINRVGIEALNNHPSELEALNFDKYSIMLENNGTEEEFKDLVIKEYSSGRYKEWSF